VTEKAAKINIHGYQKKYTTYKTDFTQFFRIYFMVCIAFRNRTDRIILLQIKLNGFTILIKSNIFSPM
jgi:hypothetical protein